MKNIEQRIDKISSKLEEFIENAELWYAIFLDAPFAVTALDKEFNFLFVNEEFLRLTKWDKSIIGQNLHVVIPEDIREIHSAHEADFLANPRSRVGNMGLHPKILTKDNKIIDVEISLNYVTIDNKFFFVCYMRPMETLYNSISL